MKTATFNLSTVCLVSLIFPELIQNCNLSNKSHTGFVGEMVKCKLFLRYPAKNKKKSLELKQTFRVDMIHLCAAIWPRLLLIECFALS